MVVSVDEGYWGFPMKPVVLVVEDNADNMKLVRWILEGEQYDLAEAENAERGLEILASRRVDLILMDISLPGMDGKEATRIIKADPRYKSTPVVALTAHAVRGEDVAIMESGVSVLLTKPIDEEVLIETIQNLIPAGSRDG